MKNQLNISILGADKFLTNAKNIESFVKKRVTIEQKTDGVKLTVVKKSSNSRVNHSIKDYIFSYKGNVLVPGEFDYQDSINDTVGASQFKAVFDHFSKIGPNSIPVGTELFIEFLMKKPTLSSSYTDIHKMVLIGYSECTWEQEYGKLKTFGTTFQTELREKYANELGIGVPKVIFKGVLSEDEPFVGKTIEEIKQELLAVPSQYGGKEEGVVFKFDDESMPILKFQQDYQNDPTARQAVKNKYRATLEEEDVYWKHVKSKADHLSAIVMSARQAQKRTKGDGCNDGNDGNDDLERSLRLLSKEMKKINPLFKHPKKSIANIKDDIQLSAKTNIIRSLKGNNNALVIGKFRVVTKNGHIELIKRAAEQYDNVVVCIITGRENKNTRLLRERMIKRAILSSGISNFRIMHKQSANIVRVIQDSPININAVFAGSDRIDEYREQLKRTSGVTVRELKRSDSDISASKVIKNIHNQEYFNLNVHESIHNMYYEVLNTYVQL